MNVAGDLQGDWDIRGKIGSVTVKADRFRLGAGYRQPVRSHPDELGGVNKITVTGGVFNSQINSSGRLATSRLASGFEHPDLDRRFDRHHQGDRQQRSGLAATGLRST